MLQRRQLAWVTARHPSMLMSRLAPTHAGASVAGFGARVGLGGGGGSGAAIVSALGRLGPVISCIASTMTNAAAVRAAAPCLDLASHPSSLLPSPGGMRHRRAAATAWVTQLPAAWISATKGLIWWVQDAPCCRIRTEQARRACADARATQSVLRAHPCFATWIDVSGRFTKPL